MKLKILLEVGEMGFAITGYEDVGQIIALLGAMGCHGNCMFGFSKKDIRIYSPKDEKDIKDESSIKIIKTTIKKMGWEKFTLFFQQFSEPFQYGIKSEKFSDEYVVDKKWLKVKIKHPGRFNVLKKAFVDGQRLFDVGKLPKMMDYFHGIARDFGWKASLQEKVEKMRANKVDDWIRQQDIERYEYDPQVLFQLKPEGMDKKYVLMLKNFISCQRSTYKQDRKQFAEINDINKKIQDGQGDLIKMIESLVYRLNQHDKEITELNSYIKVLESEYARNNKEIAALKKDNLALNKEVKKYEAESKTNHKARVREIIEAKKATEDNKEMIDKLRVHTNFREKEKIKKEPVKLHRTGDPFTDEVSKLFFWTRKSGEYFYE